MSFMPRTPLDHPRRRAAGLITPWLALAVALGGGCTPTDVDTTYGRVRDASINGTGAFAALLRARGHAIRPAVRYTDVLAEWANVIVRFAPKPGPPDAEEAVWLREWLEGDSGRKLIYVPADFTADAEFWAGMLAALPADADEAYRTKIKARLDESRKSPPIVPRNNPNTDESREWFVAEPVVPQRPNDVRVATRLDGPWAEGVDAAAAALPIHRSIQTSEPDAMLLEDDGKGLVTALDFRQNSAGGGMS